MLAIIRIVNKNHNQEKNYTQVSKQKIQSKMRTKTQLIYEKYTTKKNNTRKNLLCECNFKTITV